jgi:hypothetical protein
MSIDGADDADETDEVAETRNWPELVTSVYSAASGGGGSLSIRVQDMDIQVPSRTGPDAEQAHWNIDGTIEFGEREE